eukprot:SAG31_NODE_1054_length_10140_cov_4.264316_12_plen_103_part_00
MPNMFRLNSDDSAIFGFRLLRVIAIDTAGATKASELGRSLCILVEAVVGGISMVPVLPSSGLPSELSGSLPSPPRCRWRHSGHAEHLPGSFVNAILERDKHV